MAWPTSPACGSCWPASNPEALAPRAPLPVVPTMPPEYLESLGGGLYTIDTGFHRPRFDAAYLLVDQGHAAFIDTGTNAALPRLLGSLYALGLAPESVDWVIPTHVHLDHAGGAGALMQSLPRAKMLVHPRGAPHMIDPSRLYQGALAVYGQAEMDRNYGQLVPVPAQRVQPSHDGQVIAVGGRRLELIDTPGHARHHHCIWDEGTGGWFTGDSFGLSYRCFDNQHGAWIVPTATPVQFEPQPLIATIRRMAGRAPQWIYPTHYGRVGDVPRVAQLLIDQIEEMVALSRPLRTAPDRHAALVDTLRAQTLRRAADHGLTDTALVLDWLGLDIELNAQGLAIWLDREAA